MRRITQGEAEAMCAALKEIAGFGNVSARQDGAQGASRLAHDTLDRLGLYLESDAQNSGRPIADD
jgi:hypothetical protein